MRFLERDYNKDVIFMGSMWALCGFMEKEDYKRI
jgi:hypothetical protein